MKQKLSKIIKQVNKENAPLDGWKPKDRVSDIYEIRMAIQTFLEEKLKAEVTGAGIFLSGGSADFNFEIDNKKYLLNITDMREENDE